MIVLISGDIIQAGSRVEAAGKQVSSPAGGEISIELGAPNSLSLIPFLLSVKTGMCKGVLTLFEQNICPMGGERWIF